MLESEYNSAVRQSRVKNYLNTLRVTSFVAQRTEMSAALAKVCKSIIHLSRQAPRSHQGDAHKVEFLRNAVVGTPWSSEPLSRVATHDLTFQQLYTELEAALQLDKESKLAILRYRAQLGQGASSSDDNAGIMYTGQGRYFSTPSSFRYRRGTTPFQSSPNRQSTNTRVAENRSSNPLSVSGCFEGLHAPIEHVQSSRTQNGVLREEGRHETNRGPPHSGGPMPTT